VAKGAQKEQKRGLKEFGKRRGGRIKIECYTKREKRREGLNHLGARRESRELEGKERNSRSVEGGSLSTGSGYSTLGI